VYLLKIRVQSRVDRFYQVVGEVSQVCVRLCTKRPQQKDQRDRGAHYDDQFAFEIVRHHQYIDGKQGKNDK
jgi:hypothetical protein